MACPRVMLEGVAGERGDLLLEFIPRFRVAEIDDFAPRLRAVRSRVGLAGKANPIFVVFLVERAPRQDHAAGQLQIEEATKRILFEPLEGQDSGLRSVYLRETALLILTGDSRTLAMIVAAIDSGL